MTWNATTNRNLLLGGATSVLVHVAVAFGFPVAPSITMPAVEPGSGVVWLEPVGAGADESETPASSAAGLLPSPGVRSRSVARRAPAVPDRGEANAQTLESAPAVAALDSASRAPDGAPGEGAAGAAEGLDAAARGAAPAQGDHGTGAGQEAGAGDGVGAGSSLGSGPGSAAMPVQAPQLIAWSNPCAGHFPPGAHVAHGSVQVEVEVGPNGRIAATRVMAEQPRGEGFGGAARACAARLRFAPAQTAMGTPVAGHARLLLRFDRT